MLNKVKHFCMLIILLLWSEAKAQQINIGQKIPALKIDQFLNGPSGRAKLTSFTGKPLLIAFWNTTCSDAVELLPVLDSIQEKHIDRIKILVIAYQTAAEINKKFSEIPFLSQLSLPIVVNDTAIRNVFPHRSQPHLVWINSKGVVQAITSNRELTPKNLSEFLDNKLLQLPLKRESMDPNVFFSLTPLMVNDYENTKQALGYYSYIGGRREGIMSGSSVASYNKNEGVVRIHAENNSIYRLYKLAYKKMIGFHDKRIIMLDSSDDKKSDERYCYDLIIRDTSKQKAYAFMRQDLDRFFGLTSSLEKRKIKVLVLKRISSIDKLKWNETGPKQTYFDKKWFYAHGIEISNILNWFNGSAMFQLPLVDETVYTGRIDLVMNADFKDLPAVRKSLSEYDLDLVEEEREMEVIVLRKYIE